MFELIFNFVTLSSNFQKSINAYSWKTFCKIRGRRIKQQNCQCSENRKINPDNKCNEKWNARMTRVFLFTHGVV